MQETQVRFLGQEDPLKKEMATHSSTLTWEIPWTEAWRTTVHGVAEESDMTKQQSSPLKYSLPALPGNAFLSLWDLVWIPPRTFSLTFHTQVRLGLLLHFLTLLSLFLIQYFSNHLVIIILFTFCPGQIMNYIR